MRLRATRSRIIRSSMFVATGPTAADILALGPHTWVTASASFCVKAGGGTPAVGDKIEQMTDRSGNARHWTNGTGSTQAKLQTVSGKNNIAFLSASNDSLTVPSLSSLTSGGEAFIVHRIANSGYAAGQQSWWSSGSAFVGNWYAYIGDIYDDFGSTTRHGPVTVSALDAMHIYNPRAVSGTWSAYKDGTLLSSTGNTVGWNTSLFSYFASGENRELNEVLIFPPMTALNRETVMTYLRNSWGTP